MNRNWLAPLFAVALVVTACAPGSSGPSERGVVPQPSVAPNASATSVPTPTTDTSISARPAGAPRAILVDDIGTGQALHGRPVDPRTLADVPGYAPISFGHHYLAQVSPNGATIAAIFWPGGASNSGATMHLIDTAAWTDKVLDVKINSYTSGPRFDASGRTLFWTQPTTNESTSDVFRLDLDSRAVRQIARLPDGFYVRDIQVVAARVAVYAEPIVVMIDGKPRDVPTVFLIDPITAKITASVPLPMRAGQVRDPSAPSDEPYRGIEPGFAWDLPRSRVFITDAESDKVYTIDLQSGEMRGPFVPKPRLSMLDLLWSFFGSVAEAKMTSATRQQAAVSPDGSRLFVTGVRSDFVKGQDGKYREVVTPMDLRVIDTTDMSLIAALDGADSGLWPTPDGATLLYSSNRYEQTTDGWADRVDYKINLVDVSRARVTESVAVLGQPRVLAFDTVGRSAYLATFASGHATVRLIDSVSGKTIAEREMDRHFADVLLLRPY
jgi:hypothetical protein